MSRERCRGEGTNNRELSEDENILKEDEASRRKINKQRRLEIEERVKRFTLYIFKHMRVLLY